MSPKSKEQGDIYEYSRLNNEKIIKYISIREMEENKETSVDSKKVAEELKNIDKIQKSIIDLQAHIKFLLKRQNDENKKINQLYDLSIRKAASKITFASSVAQSQQNKKKKMQESSKKNSQVRQFRQKQINLMKQTRMQISKLREVQRSEVKQISKRNDERIKRMKEQQRKTNFNKAFQLKSRHAQYLQQKKMKRQQEKKQKEQQILKRSLIKISEKQKLEIEIAKLKEQEEEIAARLQKKKQIKLKLHDTTRKISSMDNYQIIEKTRNYKDSGLTTPTTRYENDVNEDLEKSLIKSAVRKIVTQQKQPIMLFR